MRIRALQHLSQVSSLALAPVLRLVRAVYHFLRTIFRHNFGRGVQFSMSYRQSEKECRAKSFICNSYTPDRCKSFICNSCRIRGGRGCSAFSKLTYFFRRRSGVDPDLKSVRQHCIFAKSKELEKYAPSYFDHRDSSRHISSRCFCFRTKSADAAFGL